MIQPTAAQKLEVIRTIKGWYATNMVTPTQAGAMLSIMEKNEGSMQGASGLPCKPDNKEQDVGPLHPRP